MDILYYSNYCKHSQSILAFLQKNDLIKSLNCICIDKRKVNSQNGQTQLLLENGNSILLPPNIHSVPALLLVKENYNVILGNAIKTRYQKTVHENEDLATEGNGEPMSYALGTKDIVSEKFTFFNASPEDLSTKGMGKNRPLYHYVPVEGSKLTIATPPDTYRPNKVSQDVTVDSLQSQRNQELSSFPSNTSFLPP